MQIGSRRNGSRSHGRSCAKRPPKAVSAVSSGTSSIPVVCRHTMEWPATMWSAVSSRLTDGMAGEADGDPAALLRPSTSPARRACRQADRLLSLRNAVFLRGPGHMGPVHVERNTASEAAFALPARESHAHCLSAGRKPKLAETARITNMQGNPGGATTFYLRCEAAPQNHRLVGRCPGPAHRSGGRGVLCLRDIRLRPGTDREARQRRFGPQDQGRAHFGRLGQDPACASRRRRAIQRRLGQGGPHVQGPGD